MSIRPTAYEFFAGGGLAGLGLTGFEILFANDIDSRKASTYRTNHPDVPFVPDDVWSVQAPSLPGHADLMWGSSPCQDLSLAGSRKGLEGQRSGAFWGFWKLVQDLAALDRAPRIVVLENVTGLLTSGKGRDFTAICQAMTEAGYRVGALEMDAAHWLPQSRPRLFVVGIKGDAPTSDGPDGPFHTPRLIAAHSRLPKAVRENWSWWKLPAPSRRNHDLASLLEDDSEVQWLDNADDLLAMVSPAHQQRIQSALASGERRIGAAYRRVRTEDGRKVQRLEIRFDGVAGCLRTPAGGSSRQYILVCDKGQVRIRRLTGREAARLMGVPDSYILPSSEAASLKVMGDAVAVPVVRALTEGLLRPALATTA